MEIIQNKKNLIMVKIFFMMGFLHASEVSVHGFLRGQRRASFLNGFEFSQRSLIMQAINEEIVGGCQLKCTQLVKNRFSENKAIEEAWNTLDNEQKKKVCKHVVEKDPAHAEKNKAYLESCMNSIDQREDELVPEQSVVQEKDEEIEVLSRQRVTTFPATKPFENTVLPLAAVCLKTSNVSVDEKIEMQQEEQRSVSRKKSFCLFTCFSKKIKK